MAISNDLLEGIQQLKPLPVTLQRLTSALGDENVSPARIADIVEYDGAVAANILKVANSAAHGGLFRIQRVRDAVVRLGTSTLLNIMLGEHLKSLKAPAPLYDLTEDDLWLHGAAASLAIKALTRELPAGSIPEASGLAALVHDIGKLIMVRYLKADVTSVLGLCRERGFTYVEAERELLGCDHAEVGAAIARKWSFPAPVARAIEFHHVVPPPDPDPMLDAVMFSNLIAKSIGVGLGSAGLNLRVDYRGLHTRLGLSVEGFERACAQTAIWVADLRTAEGIPYSPPLSAVKAV